MPRGGARAGAGRPKAADRRTAVWREYLRNRVNWREVVTALELKATSGNVAAAKLLIEAAYGTAVSMATNEEMESRRLSAFEPEKQAEWEMDLAAAGSFENSGAEISS